MTFESFNDYCKEIRNSSKNILKYRIDILYDKEMNKLKKYINFNITAHEKYLKIQYEKNIATKVLESDTLLNIYLDNEVRKVIMKILLAISISPKSHSRDYGFAISELNKMGFSDTREYLSEFLDVEDIRKDLFEKANLDFTHYDELNMKLLEAKTSNNTKELKDAELELYKNGIMGSLYCSNSFGLNEIANIPYDYLKFFKAKKVIAVK